ncbi:MAG: tetratricopeptide repeat protein, partial [Treponema sp.]|uniref:tetratricopeptide repeat protein n=1 Tax=Treponema sp. TaxID=166 RepID=UPI00361B63DF
MKKQVIAVILLVIAAVSFADTNISAKNQEDIESQYAAGLVSLIRCDYEEAFKCFKRLAEQGHAGAQYSLGMRYYLGEGTLTDKKKAFYWFTQAAEQGDAIAQHNLGRLYYLGEGTLS